MKKQNINERRQKLITLLANLSSAVAELDEAWRADTDAETESVMEPQRGTLEALVSRGSYFALHIEEWKDHATDGLRGLIESSKEVAK